jgi:type III secretion protein HrpB1
MTKLAFRTKRGAVVILPYESKQLGIVKVSAFSRIRVVVDSGNRAVRVRLVIAEGKEQIVELDSFELPVHAKLTRLYDVPGTKLMLFADAIEPSGGNDQFELLMYGC